MSESANIEAVLEDPEELRCSCGQLLANLTEKGVELKCKRCKRVHVIPWERLGKE